MFGIKKVYGELKSLRRDLIEELIKLRNSVDQHRLQTNTQRAGIQTSIDDLTKELKRAQGNFVDADFGSEQVDRVGRLDKEVAEEIEELVKESIGAPENSHIVAITPEQVYLFDEPE